MEKPLTEGMRPDGEPLSLKEYERLGGYQAWRKALTAMAPGEVTDEVKKADLRGRGGAGFPAGEKWSYVPSPEDVAGPRYVVANADEMEPGTFKDRLLMERNPHQLIEGMALCAYAIQANVAYIFLRWEYGKPARALERALAEACEANYLGRNVLGTGFRLEMRLHVSAGRYVCGEAMAVLNVLEGRRAIPRTKPPHPTVSGLRGKPTVVNNVETLSNVPHIIRKGAEWFRGLSLVPSDSGTKLYGVSGRVRRPGLWELPMGTPLREILEGCAGGMQDGCRLRGLLPGGASTEFLTDQHLSVRMDFDSLLTAGSRLGTGAVIVLDDTKCPVGMVHNLEAFFARESCGWCTPCRDGLPWTAQLLQAIEEGQGRPGDVERLDLHTRLIGPGFTFCYLAPGAMEPLRSALKWFREDFERHIRDRRCPWR
jgi:NADH-quinone oxidoreductase subunit F